MHRLLPFVALAALLSHGNAARAEAVDSRAEYIVQGEPVGRGEEYGTVGLIVLAEYDDPEELMRPDMVDRLNCSGVLIAPSIVITAAHCVDVCEDVPWCSDGTGWIFRCEPCYAAPRPSDRIFVAAGLHTARDAGEAELVPVRDVIIHKQYRSNPDWALDFGTCNEEGRCTRPGLGVDVHDIAVLRLDAPVTAVDSVSLLRDDEIPEGTLGIAQGYGRRASSDGDTPPSQEQDVSLLNQARTPIEQTTEQEILTGEGPGRSGTCFGDSGGPLLIQNQQGVWLAGLFSRFRLDAEGPYCGAGGIYTFAPAYSGWIYDKAPEAVPFTLGGGGGCSAHSPSSSRPAVWLAGLLTLLLLTRRRLQE